MKLCNIEIFKPDFSFRDAAQAVNQIYKLDYISMEKNAIEVYKILAEKDDYIRITQEGRVYSGIINEISKKKKMYEIKYKPILSLFDIKVHFDKEDLKTISLEKWIKKIMEGLYKDNGDVLQNRIGFSVTTTSDTENVVMELEKNIANLYKDIIVKALINYGIVVTEKIDFMEKRLEIIIGKVNSVNKHIETDFPNIVKAELISKKSKEFSNKATIYNEKNEVEYETYFLTTKGEIKKDVENNERIVPVVEDMAYISFEQKKEEITFYDKAYEKAVGMLNKGKYDNLIEVEVYHGDKLVEPLSIEIGSEVEIKIKGDIYRTILTGKEEQEKTVVLIFGAIRLELTKFLAEKIR